VGVGKARRESDTEREEEGSSRADRGLFVRL